MSIQTKTAPVSDIGDGQFHVLLSTADKDRDGEQLHLSQWKTPLPQHIPFGADHDTTTNGLVGSGVPELTSRGLEVRGRWANSERANHVRKMVSSGHVRHVSVEYLPRRDENGSVTRELVGGSFVYSPSNPAARVLESKSADDQPSTSDLLQAIHDASAILGARCASQPEPVAGDGSDEGANKAIDTAVAVKARLLRMRLS